MMHVPSPNFVYPPSWHGRSFPCYRCARIVRRMVPLILKSVTFINVVAKYHHGDLAKLGRTPCSTYVATANM
jgi:hypothetical protein